MTIVAYFWLLSPPWCFLGGYLKICDFFTAPLKSLGAVQVHVLMHHTKLRRLQKNLFLVSNDLTYGIPFQTVDHELDLFLRILHH